MTRDDVPMNVFSYQWKCLQKLTVTLKGGGCLIYSLDHTPTTITMEPADTLLLAAIVVKVF